MYFYGLGRRESMPCVWGSKWTKTIGKAGIGFQEYCEQVDLNFLGALKLFDWKQSFEHLMYCPFKLVCACGLKDWARRHTFFFFLKIQVVQHDSQIFTLKGVSHEVIQDFLNIGIYERMLFSWPFSCVLSISKCICSLILPSLYPSIPNYLFMPRKAWYYSWYNPFK